MNPLPCLLTATLLAGVVALPPAFAAEGNAAPPAKAEAPAKPDMAVEMSKEYHEQLRNGNLMIGHISMALMALDYGATDIAKTDVAEALKLATALEKGAPEVKSKETMSFGKLSHEHEGRAKDFYIPIVDDSFMVHGLETRGKAKDPKVRETDAVMVHSHVSLDVRKAVSGLTEAKTALESGQPAKAGEALNGILKAAVGSEVAVSDPLHTVHDNLVLAQNLLEEKRYGAARFALKYAKKGLGDYNFLVHEPERKQHVEQMQKDIDALSEELRKEDPAMLQKSATTIKGWGSAVKKWLTSHPEPGHEPEHPFILKHNKNDIKQGQ